MQALRGAQVGAAHVRGARVARDAEQLPERQLAQPRVQVEDLAPQRPRRRASPAPRGLRARSSASAGRARARGPPRTTISMRGPTARRVAGALRVGDRLLGVRRARRAVEQPECGGALGLAAAPGAARRRRCGRRGCASSARTGPVGAAASACARRPRGSGSAWRARRASLSTSCVRQLGADAFEEHRRAGRGAGPAPRRSPRAARRRSSPLRQREAAEQRAAQLLGERRAAAPSARRVPRLASACSSLQPRSVRDLARRGSTARPRASRRAPGSLHRLSSGMRETRRPPAGPRAIRSGAPPPRSDT